MAELLTHNDLVESELAVDLGNPVHFSLLKFVEIYCSISLLSDFALLDFALLDFVLLNFELLDFKVAP